MKSDLITKATNKEKLLRETYKHVLEVGFADGSLDLLPKFFKEDIMGIGSAVDEMYFSISELKEIILDQRKQSKSFDDYYIKSNPVFVKILEGGTTAIIIDNAELTTIVKGKENKLSPRMTVVFEFVKEGWKVIHWHASISEHVSGGEDPWHLEEWKKKNEELQKAVDEKTADLLFKNRELEIEAGLERVRAVAMGMKKSEDLLKICEVSYHEFEKLGFENLRAVLIHILNDEKRTFFDYDYCKIFGGKITTLNYDSHPAVLEFFNQITSADDAFAEAVLSGDELESFKKVREETGQKDDPRLYDAHALYYYGYSIGVGDFTISTLKPINEAQRLILKKFRNVFDLAYKRYNDIANAEAREREARIETALERVRGKAMAMNSSEDLTETADLFFSELIKLNIKPHRCGFGIVNKDNRIADVHATSYTKEESLKIVTGKLKLYGHPVLDKIYEGFEKQEEYHPVLKGKEILEYYEVMNPQIQFPDFADDEVQYGYYFYFKEGGVFAWSDNQYTDDELDIFRRYTSVLSLTYKRYFDLKKAEAQAREAQIEAALERVRSLAVGMRQSDEVGKVSDALFSELQNLSVKVLGCTISVIDEKEDKMELWRARSATAVNAFEKSSFSDTMSTLNNNMPKMYTAFIDARKAKQNYLVTHHSFEERNQLLSTIAELYNYDNKQKKKLFNSLPKEIVSHYIFFKIGYLGLLTENQLSIEELTIARRFIEVFDFTYTRFYDLKKAEAQAREGQIQLALEKVRLVALGLKKSEEMLEVAKALYEQLILLGFSNIRNAIIDIENGDGETFTDYDYSQLMSGTITQMSYKDDPTLQGQFKKMATTTDDFFELLLEGKELQDLINMRLKNGEASDPRLLKTDLVTYNLFSFGNGAIGISNFGVLNEDEKSILDRFRNVFTFAYKRYTDLTSAEAQAREAQIEVALERVRTRSMAMHKSEELADLSLELVKQVQSLGVSTWFCAFNIYDDDSKGSSEWGSNGQVTFPKYRTPREGIFLKYFEAGEKGETLLINVIDEKECPAHYEYLCSLPVVGDQLLKMKADGIQFPTSQIDHVAYFNYGYIIFITFEPAPEAHDIFKRFAKVFEQTYTRFLDLQKSEEQRKIIQAENERKTLELEEARKLQLAMLPKELPKLSKLDIAVYMKTATEVGGDYYDYSIKDDGSLNICLGDATGHGLKAGTLVAMMKSLFVNDSVKLDILKFFTSSNETLKKMSLNKMMMAFAMINIYGHKIKISNAGIPPIFIFRKDKKLVEEINLNGLPIGAIRGAKYEVWQNELKDGDTVLMLSDGMPELQNSNNVMYGYEKIKEVFLKNAEKTSEEIISVLTSESKIWSEGTEPDDDITFVVIKVK